MGALWFIRMPNVISLLSSVARWILHPRLDDPVLSSRSSVATAVGVNVVAPCPVGPAQAGLVGCRPLPRMARAGAAGMVRYCVGQHGPCNERAMRGCTGVNLMVTQTVDEPQVTAFTAPTDSVPSWCRRGANPEANGQVADITSDTVGPARLAPPHCQTELQRRRAPPTSGAPHRSARSHRPRDASDLGRDGHRCRRGCEARRSVAFASPRQIARGEGDDRRASLTPSGTGDVLAALA